MRVIHKAIHEKNTKWPNILIAHTLKDASCITNHKNIDIKLLEILWLIWKTAKYGNIVLSDKQF